MRVCVQCEERFICPFAHRVSTARSRLCLTSAYRVFELNKLLLQPHGACSTDKRSIPQVYILRYLVSSVKGVYFMVNSKYLFFLRQVDFFFFLHLRRLSQDPVNNQHP